ncbi:MAG: hypothetical protein ACOYB3_01660 [Azonexus sp.]
MKVAVVCRTQAEAVALVATLGMVGKALPIAAESSPLLGHHFTAVVIRSVPQRTQRDDDWWETLFTRNTGPVYTLNMLGSSQDAVDGS